MDNNELDKILKEKLKNRINPSAEFEKRVLEKVEGEKEKMKNVKFEQVKQESKSKNRIYKKLTPILSIAAMLVIVFTLGMNLRTKNEANLLSIKAIEPTKTESGIIANDSEFTIYAEGDNLNVETIQKNVYVEPALDYTIEKTANKNEYKLKFKQNIPDNTIVKLQYVKNQITEDSWAYQTSNKLSITKTYPENNNLVEKKSVVDIEFSYASVNNFKQNVKMTPAVEGNWEHLGNIWRFTPKNGFKQGTKYTITISKDIEAEGQKLDRDYILNFAVDGEGAEIQYGGITLDGISTAGPNEVVRILCYGHSTVNFGKAELSRFSSIDDFIEYVQTNNSEKATKYGDYEIEDKGRYIEFKKSLQKGYYVAKIKNSNGKELFNCPIQISNYSAYAMETERDVLVWVAQNGDLAKNVKVEYQNKTINTNEQGIVKFENIADGSETVKYARIGEELVIGVYNYNLENYPRAYVYTDRPLYKNTDTINIWGFIPKKLFYEKVEDEFYVELDGEGKQKISVGADGNFTYKIDLRNHFDNKDASISLYYKNRYIGGRSIGIENYELQNYTYEVNCNKNYGFVGDTIEFDVKVRHITGLLVPNKRVAVTYENQTLIEKTGEDGVAHFKVQLEKEENRSDNKGTEPYYQSVSIYNGDDTEYTNAETLLTVIELNRDTYTWQDHESENYKATLYKLETDKNININSNNGIKDLYNGTYETTVEIRLKEIETTRVQTGESYNEYTKKMEPEYEYIDSENISKIKTVQSTNGVVEVKKDEIKTKKDTEDKTYSYMIQLLFKDQKGRAVKEELYVENYYQGSGEGMGYIFGDYLGSSDSKIYEINQGIDTQYYWTYRYLLKNNEKSFSIGETVDFTLAEATANGGVKEINNDGKLLVVYFKENISETSILTESKFNHKYTDKDFPGFKMTSAYFINGKFYRMPAQYFDFNEEDRKVDIEITSDKEQYKPGDEVTLNIKTTLKGKAVKSFVNISVVNEAVFELEEDRTELVNTIYSDKSYPVYTYSSYTDTTFRTDGGEGGGDGGIRGSFADTAHFETVYTGGNGTATVKFKLPDNVTTYRVTAQSANEDLELGVNTKQIVSKLDFFVQSIEPRGVKTTDDLVLNATSIADTKYNVDYEFTIKELNKTLTANGITNNLVTVNFGKLPFGTYHAVIKGKHDSQEDGIEYEFKVVEATQEVKSKTTMSINDNIKITPSRNPIQLEVYNKNMSKYVEYIDFIENTLTERLDTQIAYNKSKEIKDKYYGTSDTSLIRTEMSLYQGENFYLKNLRNGKEDLVLTALVQYYAKDYYNSSMAMGLQKGNNVFEYYLLAAAKGEPVLNDLLYLKDEKDISNYNKLLITLGLEFAGDFQNAKDIYKTINLSNEEVSKYKSIIAIIETFIDKSKVTAKIDDLIKNSPADEYLRFAILSYFQNNSNQIGKEETVRISSKNLDDTITVNGMQVKTYTIYNEDLSDISFETESQDLMVSYYYQTLLENVENKNIKKDIKASIAGDIKKGETVDLTITFDGNYEGEVRIALPNSLRMARSYSEFDANAKYYIQNNNIDYITIYKTKKCKTIKIPLIVTNSGNYKFENIVCTVDGVYHISNSIDL